MTINAAAVFFLIALIIALVGVFIAPISPRVTHATIAAISAGLFCLATGLGG